MHAVKRADFGISQEIRAVAARGQFEQEHPATVEPAKLVVSYACEKLAKFFGMNFKELLGEMEKRGFVDAASTESIIDPEAMARLINDVANGPKVRTEEIASDIKEIETLMLNTNLWAQRNYWNCKNVDSASKAGSSARLRLQRELGRERAEEVLSNPSVKLILSHPGLHTRGLELTDTIQGIFTGSVRNGLAEKLNAGIQDFFARYASQPGSMYMRGLNFLGPVQREFIAEHILRDGAESRGAIDESRGNGIPITPFSDVALRFTSNRFGLVLVIDPEKVVMRDKPLAYFGMNSEERSAYMIEGEIRVAKVPKEAIAAVFRVNEAKEHELLRSGYPEEMIKSKFMELVGYSGGIFYLTGNLSDDEAARFYAGMNSGHIEKEVLELLDATSTYSRTFKYLGYSYDRENPDGKKTILAELDRSSISMGSLHVQMEGKYAVRLYLDSVRLENQVPKMYEFHANR